MCDELDLMFMTGGFGPVKARLVSQDASRSLLEASSDV